LAIEAGASGKFLYLKIVDRIRSQIEHGEYRANDRLPSIDELAGHFGTSAITVRRAIKELAAQGLVSSRQGQGSFVRDGRRIRRHIVPSIDAVHDLTTDIRNAGLKPAVRVIGLTLETCTPAIAERLALSPSDKVYRMESIILADDDPIARDRCYLTQDVGDRFRQKLWDEFVITLLLKSGTKIDHIDLTVEASAATEVECQALDVPLAFPLLTVGYTPISPRGTPLLTGRFTARGDRIAYDICQNPTAHARRAVRVRPAKR
jgi:GntR family transcriptional regulator